MRHRLLKALVAVGAVTLVVGAATVAAATTHHASKSSATASSGYNVGIVYSRTGLLAAYGAEYVEGLKYGIQYATKGTGHGERQEDQPLLRRRCNRPGHRRVADEGLHRPGRHDHRRGDVVGRRAPGGSDRGPEPRALHLRARSLGRDHGHQQVHVPLGPPDLPGRRRRVDLPDRQRQERRRLHAGLGLRTGQLRRREGDHRLEGPHRHARSTCRSRRPT